MLATTETAARLVERSTKPNVVGSSPAGRASDRTTAFPFGEAISPAGIERLSMLEIINEGGVDLNTDGLIEKRSLREFNECAALVAHWDD
jgi:hypothetical protein